jgi:hypothetical protein
MLNIEQIKKDMDNGVIICKVTLVALVDEALRLQKLVAEKMEGEAS